MSHEKRFKGIPMSKSMRGLCKEEDYAFLGMSENTTKFSEAAAGVSEDEWKEDLEERSRLRRERERQEKERQREIEEREKEKDEQQKSRAANPTSSQEKTLQDRLARLRKFRQFQRKVMAEEMGMEDGAHGLTAGHLHGQIL